MPRKKSDLANACTRNARRKRLERKARKQPLKISKADTSIQTIQELPDYEVPLIENPKHLTKVSKKHRNSKTSISRDVTERDVNLWQNRPSQIKQEENERCDEVVNDLYCNYDAAIDVAKGINHGDQQGEQIHCGNCNSNIVGFRYACVQCINLDLCVTCESNGVHGQHYVLRIPRDRPYSEIESILTRLRRCLLRALDPMSVGDSNNDEDVFSVKSEIKIEDEEVINEMELDSYLTVDKGKMDYYDQNPQLSYVESVGVNNKDTYEVSPNPVSTESKSFQQHVRIFDVRSMSPEKCQNQIDKLNENDLADSHNQQGLNVSNIVDTNDKTISMANDESHSRLSDLSKYEEERPEQKKVKILNHCIMKEEMNHNPKLLRKLKRSEIVYSPVRHREVKVSRVKQYGNKKSVVTLSSDNEPIPANTAKQKIVFGLSEFMKLKQANETAKKVFIMPSTSAQSKSKTRVVLAPVKHRTKTTAKLMKLPLSRNLIEQEK